ncbi:MAG: AmmeMemoRadiSam system protein B [Deltaproteobacteria bacterium]
MKEPKLRRLEAFPVEHEGEHRICLRDPENLSGKYLLVSPEGLFIASLLDGKRTVLDIQQDFMRRFGELAHRDDIEWLIYQLDDALLLESGKFRARKAEQEERFTKSAAREPSHSGISYPADGQALTCWLDGFFQEAQRTRPAAASNGRAKAIISPHIDFSRGGKSYALAYREILNSEADVFVIFGASHYADVDNPFILTRKSYDTPLGRAECNLEIMDNVQARCGSDLFEGEIFHRKEHSIEFQTVFLRHLFGGKEFTIVPVLCNSFYRMVQEGTSPSKNGRVREFLGAIAEIIAGLGDRAVVVAGADMAHVGLKFGDSERVSPSTLRWISQRDTLSLGFAEKLDAEGFYRTVEEEKDKRKICGLSSIYALLSTVAAERGTLLDYGQALEPETGSVVSYASMGFY